MMTRKAPLIATCIAICTIVGVAIVTRDKPAPLTQAFTESPAPATMPADAVVFPIMYNIGVQWRMNLSINTAPPAEAWSNPEWRALHRVRADGTFPVRVWRLRPNNRTPLGQALPDVMTMYVVPMPAAFPVNYSLSLDSRFRAGDLVAIELVPGVLVTEQWPILSVIDNQSGDPTTVLPIRARIPLTGNCYEGTETHRCGG